MKKKGWSAWSWWYYSSLSSSSLWWEEKSEIVVDSHWSVSVACRLFDWELWQASDVPGRWQFDGPRRLPTISPCWHEQRLRNSDNYHSRTFGGVGCDTCGRWRDNRDWRFHRTGGRNPSDRNPHRIVWFRRRIAVHCVPSTGEERRHFSLGCSSDTYQTEQLVILSTEIALTFFVLDEEEIDSNGKEDEDALKRRTRSRTLFSSC